MSQWPFRFNLRFSKTMSCSWFLSWIYICMRVSTEVNMINHNSYGSLWTFAPKMIYILKIAMQYIKPLSWLSHFPIPTNQKGLFSRLVFVVLRHAITDQLSITSQSTTKQSSQTERHWTVGIHFVIPSVNRISRKVSPGFLRFCGCYFDQNASVESK